MATTGSVGPPAKLLFDQETRGSRAQSSQPITTLLSGQVHEAERQVQEEEEEAVLGASAGDQKLDSPRTPGALRRKVWDEDPRTAHLKLHPLQNR